MFLTLERSIIINLPPKSYEWEENSKNKQDNLNQSCTEIYNESHIRESKEYNKKEYSILNHTGIDHAFNIYVANAHMLNKNASTIIFPANLYIVDNPPVNNRGCQ